MGCTASVPKKKSLDKAPPKEIESITTTSTSAQPLEPVKKEAPPAPKDPNSMRMKTYFTLGERVKDDETITNEYKDYFYPLRRQKRAIIKNTICAFLNRRGGRIYIGIDDAKIVKGIFMKYKERDMFRLDIQHMVKEFEPSILNEELIKIVEIPIRNPQDNAVIPGLFVVKIIVKQGDTSKLYSVGAFPFEPYIRNEGQTTSLPTRQITEYIIQRHLNPGEKVSDEDFKDPVPDEIKDIYDEEKTEPKPHEKSKKRYNSENQKNTQHSPHTQKNAHKGGYPIQVYIPKKESSPKTPPIINKPVPDHHLNQVQISVQKESPPERQGRNPVSAGKLNQKKARVPGASPGQRVYAIFLQGLPSSMVEYKLKAIIDQMNLSSFISMKMFFDYQTGVCNGKAFVNFASHDEAKLALIGLNSKEIEGSIVKAELDLRNA